MLKQCQSPNITQYFGSQAGCCCAGICQPSMVGWAGKAAHSLSRGGPAGLLVGTLLCAAFKAAGLPSTHVAPARLLLQAVPGTSQLMIVMELMAASAADLVSSGLRDWRMSALPHAWRCRHAPWQLPQPGVPPGPARPNLPAHVRRPLPVYFLNPPLPSSTSP